MQGFLAILDESVVCFTILCPYTKGWVGTFVAMHDPYCVAVVGITPGSKWIAVCEHHQFLRFYVCGFEIVKDGFEVCAATALDVIICDVFEIVRILLLRIVALSVEREHMDAIGIETFHDTPDLCQEVSGLFVRD